MKLTRRKLVVAAGAGALVAGAGVTLKLRGDKAAALHLPQAGAERLNILLLVTDQERAWDLLLATFNFAARES